MDSNDMGELLLMMVLDDDLFFVEIGENDQEQEDVDKDKLKSVR